MKGKFTFVASLLAGVFAQCLLFAEPVYNVQDFDRNHDGMFEPGEVDPCQQYQTGPCVSYCPVTTFKPQYYCTTRCVPEPYTVTRQCCRYVPKYYTKQCCRYVPQYYCQQYCCYVPEYYCVNEVKYRPRTVCDQHCCYVPCTTIRRSVEQCAPSCPPPVCAPQQDCCQPANNCCPPANNSCCN